MLFLSARVWRAVYRLLFTYVISHPHTKADLIER